MNQRTQTERKHWSPSQLDLACKCGEAYRRRYLENEVIPPGIALMKGRGLHGGAKVNMTQKIETRIDLPVSDIVDAAVASFEKDVKAGFVLSQEETSRGTKTVIAEAKDDVVELARVHAIEQAPEYQPTMVEARVRIVLPDAPRDLLGIIDLADTRDIVTDFKTSSKRKNQTEVDGSVQLTSYAAAFKTITGRDPRAVRLDTVVRTKTKTYRHALDSTRSSDDYNALANRINAVARMVDAGVFVPAMPGAWWCAPKWCGYWSTCPFVNSQRKALAESPEE